MNHQPRIVALREYLARAIVGQQQLLDRLIIGLLTGGHVLVEGVPGLAKTTAVKALASGVHASFQRIQFTPDLLPGDITGTYPLPEAQLDRFLLHVVLDYPSPDDELSILQRERQKLASGTTAPEPPVIDVANGNGVRLELSRFDFYATRVCAMFCRSRWWCGATVRDVEGCRRAARVIYQFTAHSRRREHAANWSERRLTQGIAAHAESTT